jgi:hypothetical protein
MTREQVQLFITKTPTHYRDLNPVYFLLCYDDVFRKVVYNYEFIRYLEPITQALLRNR